MSYLIQLLCSTMPLPVWAFIVLLACCVDLLATTFLLLFMFMLLEVPLELKKAISKFLQLIKHRYIYLYNNKKLLYRVRYSRKALKMARNDIAYGRATSLKIVREKDNEGVE